MDSDAPDVPLDVLVIGAGISGIGFAQTYLTVHPDCRLLVVDRDSHPGGAWSARRLYPTFRSQIGLGMAEFSDMPMALMPGEECEHSFMDGKAVSRYLEEYLDRQIHNGSSLRARLKLNFEIRGIERRNNTWSVSGTGLDGILTSLHATKLVVASGLTSEPHMPTLPNKDLFQGLVIHQEDFGSSPVLTSEKIQNVIVLGGAKSAADMVYACVKAGKSVTWVIRESGAGPATFISCEGRGAYRNQPEYASTRLMGSLSPSPWSPENTRTKFMGRTVLGRSIMASPWANLDKLVHAVFDDARNMGTRSDFQHLRPSGSVFWANSQLGLVQHPDFWQTIAENVVVRRADVASMTRNGVILDTGLQLHCDALLCGTGWDQTFPFFTEEQRQAIGLPIDINLQNPSESALWSDLHAESDLRLRKKWPAITNPPPYHHKKATDTPYRLYKYIAPLQDPDHSVAFVGFTVNQNSFWAAEVQSLWATAYLDQRLRMPSLQQQRREVAEANVWCRRRYLLNGLRGNTLHYDLIGYSDELLAELGLDSHRSGRSLWQYWSRPNVASDLRGLKEEYLEKFEGIKRPKPESVSAEKTSPSLSRRPSTSSFFSFRSRSSSKWAHQMPPTPHELHISQEVRLH